MREDMVGTVEILNQISKSSLLRVAASSLGWARTPKLMENTYARPARLDALRTESILNAIQFLRPVALHA